MNLLLISFKNLLRQKTRSLLTLLGISIGVATIVSLSAFSIGAVEMAENAFKKGGFDFLVLKQGAADIVLSFLNEDQVREIEAVEGVDRTAEMLYWLTKVNGNPYFMIMGVDFEGLDLVVPHLLSGRFFEPGRDEEIMIGRVAAKNYELTDGEMLRIGEREYRIVGTFETGVAFQDGGVLMNLAGVQKLQDLTDTVNMVGVKLTPGSDIREIADRIEEELGGEVVSVVDVDDFDAVDQGMKIVDALTWGISLLAVVVGGIGVMNTMIMSVFERTREVGILRALGWRRLRVVGMIMIEALLLGFIAALVGSGLGVLAVKVLMQSPIVEGFIEPSYSSAVFTRAILIAFAVTVAGGIYPAYRASRFSPIEAIRYE